MSNLSPILLALSGGVDSTAAALLLREQGHSLIGCTFRTRYTSPLSLQAAANLAKQLGIEHHIIDYTERFDQTVIRYFREEYLAGRTPNPCVVCNRLIKFGALVEEADRLGCHYIATGHYARVQDGFLYRATDRQKDQTYFLWQLTPDQLARVIFPLGDMTKQQVRTYLANHGFTALSQAGESQDICFIQDDYRSFLQLPSTQGNYRLTPALAATNTSRAPLRHQGYAHYTIGQRKGLGVALGKSAFVTHIDAEHNEVTLGTHDELYTSTLYLRDVIFRGDPTQPVMAQIRYRSLPVPVTFVDAPSHLLSSSPLWAVTPGQSCVLYQSDRLVGGGIITD